VLELIPAQAAVILCLGDRTHLDSLPHVPGAIRCTIAPDEELYVGPITIRHEILAVATGHLGATEPAGLVVDQTDGWAAWTITGPHREYVLPRLAAFKLPAARPAMVQGVVAQVAGKILLQPSAIHVLVRAPVAHHLRERIFEACRDLDPRLGAPVPISLEVTLAAAGTREEGHP
jgi:hypothetical protein